MRIYNTASRELEVFRPEGEEVKIYTCGPTVYNFQHIGNYAAQIYWDLLVRTLTAEGYKVRRVLNMTDVGHLVSDADEGEDKLEKGARREGKSVWEVAQFYIDDFLANFEKLRLLPPAKIARATDYIEADEALVTRLIEGGYTYETADGIYFDTARFPAYAEFARLDLEHLQAGARVEFNDEKRNVSDFAVWKFIKPGEKHEMRWDFLGRPGYPGWHLECSTIIHEELGEPIDIHCGGIDHIPVHHTNEIAQSEAAFGGKMCRYWMHCDFLTSEGQKISKSLGNGYLIPDLEARGFSAMDYKMWVLQGHYQSARNFDFEGLAGAKARRLRYRNQIALAHQYGTGPAASGRRAENTEAYEEILAALADNLNSPKALSILDAAEGADLKFWRKMDEMFGLGLIEDSPEINEQQKKILAERAEARAQKDWAKSDALRAELEEGGITVKDTAEGQVWQYK